MTKAKQAAKTEDKKAKTLGSAEVAERLHIDSKKLRKVLRSQASKANGGARYEFKESDLPELRKMVEEHTRKSAEEKEKKAAAKKKAA